MRKVFSAVAMALLAAFFVTANCVAAEKVARNDLGRNVKLTILIDKVMQPKAGWVTEEWMVEEAAKAGFNVFSPRRGHDRLNEVRLVADWCRKHEIYYMPFMRGTLAAPDGSEADGKRVVWASGKEQQLWSPNSNEFWKWKNRYIVEYAKISRDNEHLMGVFIDYENYASNSGVHGPLKSSDLYALSYDDTILSKFAKSKDIKLPTLDLDKRKSWLDEQGLHEEFSEFQIKHWRERCRELRKAVDEIAPTFQFCIYPAPGSPFMEKAAYPEWATEKAPIILADASVYGRPIWFMPEKESLAANKQKLIDRMKVPQEAGIPFMYVGGIDPVVQGADPEFCGKNAVMISEATNGYWIFYEGPTYDKQDHADYWRWFREANKAIAQGRFQVQHKPRRTVTDWGRPRIFRDVFAETNGSLALVAPSTTGQKTEYPTVKLRGEKFLVLACKAGQPVSVTLTNHPIRRNKLVLAWEVRDSRKAKLAGGIIHGSAMAKVEFTPSKTGVYLLGASAGRFGIWSVKDSNVPVGLYARQWQWLFRGAKRLYFNVPSALKEFTLAIKGQDAETVRVNVFDPEGKRVASGQAIARNKQASIRVATNAPAGKRSGTIWSLEITRADQGELEDNAIRLDAKLPPTLSFHDEQVFEIR